MEAAWLRRISALDMKAGALQNHPGFGLQTGFVSLWPVRMTGSAAIARFSPGAKHSI